MPLPTLDSLETDQAAAGGPGLTLRALGANFRPASAVRWNGAALPTTFVDRATLDAAVPAAALASAGTATVDVATALPGPRDVALTSPLTFTIAAPSGGDGAGGGGPPVLPVLTALSPAQAQAGAGGLTLRVLGTDFLSVSRVRWNGADRPTTFVSATELRAAIPAADLATAGTTQVTVATEVPGVGPSVTLPQSFTIGASPSGGQAALPPGGGRVASAGGLGPVGRGPVAVVAAAAGLRLRAAAPGVVLPGGILTIAGRFRARPDAVLIGGVRPVIVSRSATLVRVIVPDLAPGRARLTVIADGRSVSAPAAIAIASPPDQPPVANLVSYPGASGAGVVFDATLSIDPEGAGLLPATSTEMALGAGLRSVLWRFGDGSTSTAPVTTHTYPRPGTYTATLEVTDAHGQTGSASQTVEAAPPPTATTNAVGHSPTRPINIRIPSQVVFDFGSFALRRDSRRYLRRVAQVVRRAVGMTRVAGHTDSIGPARFNRVLSLRRARVVRGYLAARGPIALGRLRAVGYGESHPLTSNATELGRQENRRVVLTFRLPNRSFARI